MIDRTTHPYGLVLSEFLALDPNDINDIPNYWNDYKLPHPGCPVSFQLVVAGVRFFHNRNTAAEWNDGYKKLVMSIAYKDVATHQNYSVVRLYFSLKDKTILVPLSVNGLDWGIQDIAFKGNELNKAIGYKP